MRTERMAKDALDGQAHDWEGFMAYHSVGLFCHVLNWSHGLADHLAARAAAWWLHRHPQPALGRGANLRN